MKEWTNTWHKKLKLFYLIVSFSYLGGQKHWKINKSKQNILSWQFFTLWPKRLGFPFKFNATNPIHSKHFSPKYHSTELTGTIKTAKICTFQELSTLETSKSKPVRPLRVGDNTLWLTPDQPRVYIYVHTESYKSFSRRLSLPRELAVFFFFAAAWGRDRAGFRTQRVGSGCIRARVESVVRRDKQQKVLLILFFVIFLSLSRDAGFVCVSRQPTEADDKSPDFDTVARNKIVIYIWCSIPLKYILQHGNNHWIEILLLTARCIRSHVSIEETEFNSSDIKLIRNFFDSAFFTTHDRHLTLKALSSRALKFRNRERERERFNQIRLKSEPLCERESDQG